MLCRLHGDGQLAHGRPLLLHWPWAEAALPRPVRDGGRHRTQSLAAAASCSALQLVAKRPSPVTRVAHRMHACWLRRLRACGPASSSWRCTCAQELCAQLPEHVAPAGLYLVGSADETGC